MARFAIAAFAALLPIGALAQTPAPNEGLPSLTPRVFTSTGPARVALPSIQRQPLTGFGPPPRTYVVPAERESVVQPFEPPVEALPPLAIAAPAEPTLRTRPGRTLRAEAALGSYLARSARLDLQATGESGLFFLDVDVDGLSGTDTDEYVHSDRLAVRAGGQTFAPGRLRLEGFVVADSYSLPGAAVTGRRRRLAAGTTVGVSGLGDIPFALKAGYTQSSLALTDGESETNEGRVDAEGRVSFAGDHLRLDATGGLAGAGSGIGQGLGDTAYGTVGASYAAERPGGVRFAVGVRGLVANADDAGGTDATAVGPILDLRLPLSPTSAAFAVNTPRLDVRSLASLAALNPFVATGVVVAPDVFPVDAQAGLELGGPSTRVRLYGLATYSPSRLVFTPGGGGFFVEDYVGATTAGVGADLTAGSGGGISASAGVEARYGRVDGGGDLPFYAPFVGRAGIEAPFSRGRGRVGLSARAESARPESSFGSADAPAFGLVALDARFDIGGPFAVVGRAERLVGTVERWPGYPEAPFTAVLGLRLTR